MKTPITTQLLLALWLGLHGTLLGGDPAPMRSLEPPVMLPDETEFKTWEEPLRFDRPYYVDQTHPDASDANPGTRERPFKTINLAAQILQPGERVVVASGIYRERVRPARGGSAPDRMISYEAAPGATVVIKGSRVFNPSWRQSTALTVADPAGRIGLSKPWPAADRIRLAASASARSGGAGQASATREERSQAVTGTPGCVAFWDFVKREPEGAHRFTAHVPAGATNDFALDAGNYVREYWSEGREATYADFPLLGRGPFGQAIRIRKEEDATFRPFLFVPRGRLQDSPIDIKGAGKSVSVVVWAIRESGNHALAGIWHEGTDLNQAGAAKVVARGQRQYALFAGLNKEGAACGHVSENGAKSFGHIYAMHKSNSGDASPAVPSDAPAEVLEFRYTRVRFNRRKAADGTWTTTARDLADVRLNPWWYPHDSLYTPANERTGGPFTIGRVIHSSRSVGFTGWIGGVAVFDRALNAEELGKLCAFNRPPVIQPAPAK